MFIVLFMLQVGDLFAGIGGFALAFGRAGAHIAWSNEMDKRACITLRHNFKHQIIENNIKFVDEKQLQPVDIITAGFPCQAFSVAGYRRGFADERGNVFFDILRFIDHHQPRAILLENVKNLTGHDNGKTFAVICESLENLGYFVTAKVLNSFEYCTVPQNRERIYIVALKNKSHFDSFQFPEKIKYHHSLERIIYPTAPREYYYDNFIHRNIIQEKITRRDTIYQWRRMYVRENKKGLCPTLTANMGMGGHNVPLILDETGIRKLTPRECARFQGYPDSYILPDSIPRTALYKQIGNSVTVPVVELLARNILSALSKPVLEDSHVHYQSIA